MVPFRVIESEGAGAAAEGRAPSLPPICRTELAAQHDGAEVASTWSMELLSLSHGTVPTHTDPYIARTVGAYGG